MKKMGDADGSRPLYVMDDDYIEQKYVKAEEERQRQAELDRARREREEAEAFAEAERQRKAAEAERRRKKEESERQEQLEAARMHRETVELERKKQQKDFENNLKDIEEELNALELSRSNFLSEKLSLAKDHKREEESLREPLDEIQKQKEELLLREQDLKIKMREFERRAEQERMQLEQKEGARDARIRELTQKRRQVQTDMLHFLQQPTTVVPVSAPKPLYSIQPTSAPSHMSQPNAAKMGAPKKAGYPTFQNEAPNPVHQSFSPQPMSSFSPIPGGYPTFAPSAPSQTALPSVEIVGNDRNGTVNDINEQIALLDEFFGSGVLSKAEYEDAKRQVYEAGKAKGAGVTGGIDMKNLPTATAVTQGPPPDSVDAQIRQLDDFLRGGVLTQGEYNDAKEKVLADAKAKSGGNAAAPKLVAPSTEEVFVTVPAGAKPGTAVRIRHNGMQYDVVVPPGMTVGSRFKAVIPK